MKNTTCLLLLLALVFCFNVNSIAQTSRALLIGINDYVEDKQIGVKFERDWSNLRGCVNDAKAVQSLLVTRYGFKDDDINFIENKKATRENIKRGFEKLISDSKPGDVVVVFYAGHGSFMINEDSKESDKIDETIVPVDADEGAEDIRDKEIRNYLNRILDAIGEDKGKLTVIFDSCHSGSATRGDKSAREQEYANDRVLGNGGFGVRHVEGVRTSNASKLDVDPRIPSERGALVISSCQDHQTSKEKTYADMGAQHGDFTYALVQALNNSPADATTSMIFNSVKNYLRIYGKDQTPTMEANQDRLKYNLFGIEQSSLNDQTIVSVSELKGKEVYLDGGISLGLHPGCTLHGFGESKKTIKLEIVENIGLASSKAKIIEGTNQIAQNDYFVVEKFVSADGPNLTIFLPGSSFSSDELLSQYHHVSKKLKKLDLLATSDCSIDNLAASVSFDQGSWQIRLRNGSSHDLFEDIDALDEFTNGHSLVTLPLSKSLYSLMNDSLKGEASSVFASSNRTACKYEIGSRVHNDQLQYCWRQFGNPDPLSTNLPIASDWVTFENDKQCSKDLLDQVFRLGKINGWLKLESPKESRNAFPYQLMIQRKDSLGEFNELLDLTDTLRTGGDLYRFVLCSKNSEGSSISKNEVQQRFVYIVTIAPNGKMELLYPYSGSGENLYPFCQGLTCPEVIPIGTFDFTIDSASTGRENILMITSDKELSGASLVFNVEGVRTRGPGSTSDLEKLLLDTGVQQRCIRRTIPQNWSIDKMSMVSK